jgi:hypothetical protein
MTDQTPTHDEAFEMMAAYIDGTLAPADVARLEPHIAECAECAALLDDNGDGVDLGGTTETRFDDAALRGSVRRTLLRTAGYASVLVVLLAVLLYVGSVLVIQPLLMNAGGRAESVARATFDLASMVNEGTVIDEFTIDSGFASRTFTTELGLPLGSAVVDAGTVASTITLGGTDPGDVWPFGDGPEPNPVPASSLLDRLGTSSVATVAARFPQPLDHADAQALADAPGADVSVIWAGFLVSAAAPEDQPNDPLRTLGYSTCSNDRLPDSLFGASSADAGGSFGERAPSVSYAYDQVRAAVERLADDEGVRGALPLGWADPVVAIDEHLGGGSVAPVETLVVTGPADEILQFLEGAEVVNAQVLAVDFYNWVGPICGSSAG